MINSASRSPAKSAATFTKSFEQECADFFAEAVQIFGVPKSVGQIYGLLYASPIPLSFSDIVAVLNISKGSASQGLQFLRTLGAISVANRVEAEFQISNFAPQAALRASRGIAFEPELSLRKLMSGVLRERVTPLAATGAERLARLRELAERDQNGSIFYLGRVKQLETWRRRLKAVLPVLNRLLGPRSKR